MTNKPVFSAQLEAQLRAGAPAIFIHSAEEARVDQLLIALQARLGLKRIHEWNLGHGWVDFMNKQPLSNPDAGTTELEHALLQLLDADLEQTLILIKGARLALENNRLAIARLKQLLNRIERGHAVGCSVILVSESVCIPASIESQVTLLPLPLPDREDIQALLAQADASGQLTLPGDLVDLAVSGLSGLTASEIGRLLRIVSLQTPVLTEQGLKTMLHEKEQIIAKSGVLALVRVDEAPDDIGGLEKLKHWLAQRAAIVSQLDKATRQGVKAPKGVLIAGMPGCGKSLTARVAASLFQLPLLRLDIGSLLGKYVGESEHNMRRALNMAEMVSPCILWVDELEKAFVGMGGGNASEVTARLLGYFLTWMQEKTGAVFVIATANDISALPPELLRKGRFDEIFYVGFPNAVEREHILKIHLRKARQAVDGLDLPLLVQQCRDYCGADIENAVNEALANAFIAGSPLTQAHLAEAIQSTIPLRETLREQVGKYEELFEKLKLRPASEYQGLSVAQMIRMAADPNQVKREEVASNPDCPDDQLEKLAGDSQRSVVKAVYENPRCPERLLTMRINIAQNSPLYDVELLALACLNDNAPEDLLVRQVKDGQVARELRAKLAGRVKGPALLQLLMSDPEVEVRRGLASNPALPEVMQLQLLKDKDTSVVAALILNPSLASGAERQLLEHGESGIKQAFAKRPELTEAEQQLLLKNADAALKIMLSLHPKLAHGVQLLLAKDPLQSVRLNLAGNPGLSKATQLILAGDKYGAVKVALAKNPGLCLDDADQLSLKKYVLENRHLSGGFGVGVGGSLAGVFNWPGKTS